MTRFLCCTVRSCPSTMTVSSGPTDWVWCGRTSCVGPSRCLTRSNWRTSSSTCAGWSATSTPWSGSTTTSGSELLQSEKIKPDPLIHPCRLPLYLCKDLQDQVLLRQIKFFRATISVKNQLGGFDVLLVNVNMSIYITNMYIAHTVEIISPLWQTLLFNIF